METLNLLAAPVAYFLTLPVQLGAKIEEGNYFYYDKHPVVVEIVIFGFWAAWLMGLGILEGLFIIHFFL